MSPRKPEIRLLVMVKSPNPPPVGIVARNTGPSQSSLVIVLGLMATDAVPGCFPIRGGRVTRLARRCCMQANQRKAGYVVVKEDLLPPPFLAMTLLTLPLLLHGVHIVELVAGVALQRQLFRFHESFVAIITADLYVLPLQRKLGLAVVVHDLLPVLPLVAFIALGAVLLLVNVILFMTGETLGLHLVLVHIPGVAYVAGDLGVLLFQRKLCLCMVIRGFLPVLFRMTVFAFGSVARLVDIVQDMTRIAILRDLLPSFLWVAEQASDFRVLPL